MPITMPTFTDLKNRAVRAVQGAFQTMSTALQTELFVPDELKPILKIEAAERTRQKEVLRARDFFHGKHGAKLVERLREFLGLEREEECEFSLNFSATVVTAVVERLLVRAIKCAPENLELSEAERQAQEGWAARLRRITRFKAKEGDIIEGAIRDGEFFVIVDFDNEGKHPRFHLHQRYTDPEVGCGGSTGDGEGVRMIHPNGDINEKPLLAVKRWVQHGEDGSKVKHVSIYRPGLVSTYARGLMGWELISEVAWVDPKTKLPLGIPVVAFYTPGRRPEAARAWVIQRIINKITLDLLQIIDVAAFRIWIYFGWSPKDEAGNALTIAPNHWIGNEKKKPDEASATAVEGSDPTPVGNVLDGLIVKLANLTDTPASRLITSRQIAAEGTLKQQSEPLYAKCRRRQMGFSQSFEDLYAIARRLENAFGEQTLDDQVLLETEWETIESRSADEELKEQQVEQAKVTVQIGKQQLGVSMKQSQRELDYTDQQMTQIAKEKGEETAKTGEAFAAAFNTGAV